MGKRKSWLKTMKNAFKTSSASSSRDSSDKRVEWSSSQRDDGYEDEGYGTMMPEIVSVEHFPSMDGDCEEEEDEDDDDEYANVVEMAAEAAAEAAKRAVHLMRLAKYGRRPSKEEMATVIIQSCFRGYLARRARRALRALVRLQAIVRGYAVRKQTQLTMQCMQSLVRVQARARAARLNLLASTPNPNNNIQGTIKHCYSNNDLYTISDYSEIDDETTHCDVNSRKLPESMLDREKELAYAFSCQERRQLGWKWLEQRMSTDQELMSSLHDSSHTMKKNIISDDLSEKTVEIDNDLTIYDQKNRFDQRDNDGGGERMKKKQGIIPSYMVATQSAKAKVREGNYSRFDHGQKRDQNRRHSGYSPDSSCGDRTPPFRGRLGKNES